MHGGLSQFRATQQRRKERSESRDKGGFERKTNGSSSDKSATSFNFPKMSEDEMKLFRANLVSERNKKTRKDVLIALGILLVIILIFYLNSD